MLKGRLKSLVLSAPLLALAMAAAPARAETVILTCTWADGRSFNMRVNYATGLIETLGTDGATSSSATASISANAIAWSSEVPRSWLTGDGVTHQTTAKWEGRIDRMSGTGVISEYGQEWEYRSGKITCRLGTGTSVLGE